MAVSGAFYWLTVAPQFTLADGGVTIEGAHFTDPAVVRSAIGLPEGVTPNLFRLRTQDMRAALETLPPVLSAEVSATLPDRLGIVLHERTPIFVWRTAAGSWLVDVSGVLFAQPGPGGDPAEAALPVISDKRTNQPVIRAGARLDALDLEAARVLGALSPDQVGSRAHSLALSVDDSNGWVLAADTGWQAIFGHFSPVLHTTADIPQQVQCLRSLLVDREDQIAIITLAVGPGRCGTYDPLASPSPGPGNPGGSGRSPVPGRTSGAGKTPDPGRTPAPSHSPAP